MPFRKNLATYHLPCFGVEKGLKLLEELRTVGSYALALSKA